MTTRWCTSPWALYLTSEGYEHQSAYDGQQALEMFENQHPDLIVLDLMMPKMSGTDVCRTIRQKSSVPIIMLTAKGEEIDRILGLELGADDYIVKPFSPREVLARIKAVLRRFSEKTEEEDSSIIRLPQLEISLENYQVKAAGKAIPCTPKEVEILHTAHLQRGPGLQPGADSFPGLGLRLFRRYPHGGRAHQAHPAEAAPGKRALGAEDRLRRGLPLRGKRLICIQRAC